MSIRSIAANFWSTLACVAALSALAIAAAVYLFGLRWSGSIGLYFVVWWTVLFVVLPIGARSQAEIGEVVSGTEPGAPAVPALRDGPMDHVRFSHCLSDGGRVDAVIGAVTRAVFTPVNWLSSFLSVKFSTGNRIHFT